MAKICPCQKEMSSDSYLFTILIIDLVLGIPDLIVTILAFIGLMISLKDNGYHNGYFNFYAWFRLIIAYINAVGLFLFCLVAIFMKDKVPIKFKEYFSTVVVIIITCIMLPIIIWQFYTSY